MLLQAAWHNSRVNNSRRAGLVLFALGVIVFFGERYVFGFFAMVASLFSLDSGAYSAVFQSSIATYWIAIILIISGVVVFYTGRRKNQAPTSVRLDS